MVRIKQQYIPGPTHVSVLVDEISRCNEDNIVDVLCRKLVLMPFDDLV